MRQLTVFSCLLLGHALVAVAAFAQVETSIQPAIASMPVPCCLISAGHPVELELIEPIGSLTASNGDFFAIRLAEAFSTAAGLGIPARGERGSSRPLGGRMGLGG